MSESDSNELLTICDTIVEDGELSYREIYQLAKWLNEHSEARKEWPGYVLVTPLKHAIEDGKISSDEARQIGRVIQEVLRERSMRLSTQVAENEEVPEGKIQITFNPNKAQLPVTPRSFEIPSRSTKGLFYEVDLRGPSCNCPDFNAHRRMLPEGDLTRCCKHILDAYAQATPEGGYPLWLGAFIKHAWKPHPKQKWKVIEVNSKPVLISSAPSEWANVFAPSENGDYDRFGYSVFDERWSYRIAPNGCDEIAMEVVALTIN